MKLNEVAKKKPKPSRKIFCDIDGVLSNFAGSMSKYIGEPYSEEKYESDPEYAKRMWDALNQYEKEGGEYWFDLKPMKDAQELWDYIKKYKPEILSSVGRKANEKSGTDQKERWIKKHISKTAKVNIVCGASNKAKHAKEGDILIDDKEKSVIPWREAGGIGILHTSAKDTIRQLKNLGL